MKTNRRGLENMKRVAFGLAVAALMGLTGAPGSLLAQSWVPAGGGTWNDIASWNPGTIPNSDSAQVSFANNFTNSPALPVFTLDSATPFTVNKITYNDTAATYYGATITPGTPAGSLIFAGTTPTIDTPAASANAADLTITAPVDLTLGLTKTGARNVFLNGAVTGFGPLVYNNVNGGTLAIGAATPIDWTAINKATGGGTLRLDALSTMTAPATLSVGAGTLQLNPASGTIGFNAAGFTKSGSGSLNFNRIATGPGGSATLQVSGGYLVFNDSLSGFASGTVASGATLQFLAAVSPLAVSVPLTLNGNGAANTLEFPTYNSKTYNMAGLTLSGDVICRVFGLINTLNFNSAITNSGANSLTFKSEGGNSSGQRHTFVMNAASTYTGNTTVNAISQEGAIKLGVANALPSTTSLTLIGGGNAKTSANLDLNGKNQTLAGLTATPNAGGAYVINSSTLSTLTLTNSSSMSYSGVLGLTGKANFSLVKQGAGSLTLTGTNVYNGGTTVSGGALLVNNTAGSGTGTGAVTVESGATLGGSGIVQGEVSIASGGTLSGTLTLQGVVTADAGAILNPAGAGTVGALTNQNTLTLNNSTLAFDLKGPGTNDVIALTGAGATGVLTLNGVNTLKMNLLNGTLPVGTYTLMTYASKSGSGSLVLSLNARNATLTAGATSVILSVTGSGVGGSLTWAGDSASNLWDVNASSNWINGSSADVFFDLDQVTFNDAGSNTPDINLSTAVQPGSVTVANTAKNYTFSGSGSLAGGMSLTKSGAGTLTLNTVNTYSGSTSVGGGKLVLSGGDNRLPAAAALRFTGSCAVDLGGNSQTVASLTLANAAATASQATNGVLAVNGAVTIGGTVANINNSLDLRETAGVSINAAAANLAVGGSDASATGNSTGELYLSAGATSTLTANQMLIARNGSSSAAGNKNIGKVHLGQATVLQANQLFVGTTRAEGTLDLQSGLTAPTVSLRNVTEGDSRMTNVQIGENGAGGTTSGFGLIDLTGATLDGLVKDMIISKGASGSTPPVVNGTFKMSLGVLDVTSLYLCKNESGGLNDNNGTFTQAGGTVKVQTLTFGSSTAGTPSSGHPILVPTYNVGTGAVLYAQTIISGSGAFGPTSARNLNLSNGTLRNYDGATDLSISGVSGAGGILNIVLAPVTTNIFYADIGRSITLRPTAVITNSGTLVKEGPGALAVNSVNSYNGATIVNNGTLSGIGLLGGSVYLNDGARLAPGTNTPGGTLTCGTLILAGGVTHAIRWTATTNDMVAVTGALTLQGKNIVELSLAGGEVPLQVPIITFSSLSGAEYLTAWTVQGVNQPKYMSQVRVYGNSLVVVNSIVGTVIRLF